MEKWNNIFKTAKIFEDKKIKSEKSHCMEGKASL